MYIAKPTDEITIYKVQTPLYDKYGVEVDSAKFSVVPLTPLVGKMTAPFEFTSVDTFNLGDNINVAGTDGLFYPNTITNVGATYRVSKKIEARIADDLSIMKMDNVCTITDLEEGIYYFANNEALIITKTFINVRISFQELNARFDELSKTIDLEAKNDEAIKSVIADFSFVPNLFSIIDMNTIRELIILKMIMWLTSGTDRYEEAKNNYIEYKKDVVFEIKKSEDGELDNPDVVIDGGNYGAISWNVRA